MILYPVIGSDDLGVFDMTEIIFFNGVVGVLTAASWWCCFFFFFSFFSIYIIYITIYLCTKSFSFPGTFCSKFHMDVEISKIKVFLMSAGISNVKIPILHTFSR